MAYQSRLEIVIDSRTGERSLRRVQDQLGRTERGGVQALGALKAAALGFAGALATIGVAKYARDVYGAVASSQKLQASLRTVTGSAGEAAEAWGKLVEFAKETPFTLDQSVQAFIRMQSLGLNPTEDALRSFGNTASAMGKDMMQMVEAVADATTGEFERLKEFGVRASKEGDQVSFTFQGITTTIANSTEEINAYLESIGNNQFAGAMADQMDTLGGKAANLEDSVYQLYLAIGDAGATDIFSQGLDAAASAVNGLTESLVEGELDEHIENITTAAGALAVLAAGKLSASLLTAAGSLTAAQVQAIRYQLALASLAGVSRTAAASQIALGAAARGASASMALLGGPVGVAIIAAGALYYFRDSLFDTSVEASETEENIRALAERMDDLTEAELRHRSTGLVRQMQETASAIREAAYEVERLKRAQSDSAANSSGIVNIGSIGGPGGLNELTGANIRLAQLTGEQEALKDAVEENKRLMAVLGDSSGDSARGASGSARTAIDKDRNSNQVRGDSILQGIDAQSRGQEIIAAQMAEAEAVKRGLDRQYAIEQEHAERMQALRDGRRQGVIQSQAEFDALAIESERQKNEQLLQINGSYWERYLAAAQENLQSFDVLAGNMLENFSGRFGDAFESMVFDARTLNDAIDGLAEGMARSVVNAIGEMAAQWLAFQAVQLVVGKTTTAAAIGEAAVAGAAISAAYGPAAIAASLATSGANSVGAIAGITATTSAMQAANIIGMAHDGIDSVPKSGTWNLEKGERVMTSETSAKLDRKLENDKKTNSGGGEMPQITQIFQISPGLTGAINAEIRKAMPAIKQMSQQGVLEAINSGGALSRATGRRS